MDNKKVKDFFRTLRADEIEVRVQSVTAKGASLLLYKNARVDMDLLDEKFGPFGWQRHHREYTSVVNGQVITHYVCCLALKDPETGEWIEKEDAGSESNVEAVKGAYSDSLKRAATSAGIGRELYSSPFIWVPATKLTLKEKNGKYSCNDRFVVSEIGYTCNRKIDYLVILNEKTREEVFRFGKKTNFDISPTPKPRCSAKAYAEEPRKEEPKKEETATPEISSSDLLVKLCAELDARKIPYSFVSDAFKAKAIGYIPDDKIKLMLTEKGMRKLENSYMKSMVQIAEDAELPYV